MYLNSRTTQTYYFHYSDKNTKKKKKKNTKHSVLYVGGYKRKKVQLEMKYSWKAIPRDEK